MQARQFYGVLSGCVAAAVVVAAEMRDIADMRESAEAVDDEGDNPSVTFGDSSLYTREPRDYDGSRNCTEEPREYDGEHESCEGCRHDLGGGQCRINLESECGKGEHEAWEGKE